MQTLAPIPEPLHLVIQTWQRDSHDLFDYESRGLARLEKLVTQSSRFFRQGAQVVAIDDEDATEKMLQMSSSETPTDYLMNVAVFEGRIGVSPAERVSLSNSLQSKKLWLVVREFCDGKYTLCEGDIIKLGRFKLRVKMMCSEPFNQLVRPEFTMETTSVGQAAPPEADGRACRICLLDGTGSDEDPLIEACSCKGSIQYVHMNCLRFWISGRLQLSEATSYTYLYTQLSCELCKTPYPSQVKMQDGSLCQLVPMPQTMAPFIVLENMMRTEASNGTENRGVYVISLCGKKTLRLGRGHESDVRISDVSISRWHATVSFTDDGKFVLEDHNSKFGTLVALRRPRLVDLLAQPGTPYAPPLTVQSGRTVFRFLTDQQHDEYNARMVAEEEQAQHTRGLVINVNDQDE